eukprot:gene11837-5167_t
MNITANEKIIVDHFENKEYDKCISELNLCTNIKNNTTVKHNILIVKYFSKKISSKELLQELENFENPNDTIIYNLSVLYFKKENYSKSVQLLSNLFSKIQTIEEHLNLKICFLLLEIFLNQNKIKESEKIIGHLENTFKLILSTEIEKISMNDISKFSFKSSNILLNYYKNRFFMLNKKYDLIKNSFNIPVMEAHLKSMNETDSFEGMKILIENKKDIDTFIYFSNLGYISVKLNKLNLSLFYLNQALKQDNISKMLLSQHYYNTGLISMKLNRYYDAFTNFKFASPFMSNNPKLWIHMGECCVEEYLKKFEEKKVILIHQNEQLDLIKLPIYRENEEKFSFLNDKLELNLHMGIKYFMNSIALINDKQDPYLMLVYLKLAHISLLIHDPIMVLSYCQIIFQKGSLQYKSIAFSYYLNAIALLNDKKELNSFSNTHHVLKEILSDFDLHSNDIKESIFINSSLLK